MKAKRWQDIRTVAVAGVVAAMSASGAYAAASIGSNDINDDSVRSIDVRDETLRTRDLSEGAREALRGQEGPQGDKGDKGDPGDPATYVNPEWGLITRNTIGSAVAMLRSGPYTATSEPPFGVGSLGLGVSDAAMSGSTAAEKVSFGNEVDFAGDNVTELLNVGFHVFQTGENHARSAGNLPTIQFEIDPNLEGVTSNYSSLVWVPADLTLNDVNKWSGYIDATVSGQWGLTGAAGTATGCSLGASMCELDTLLTELVDAEETEPAKILSAQIVKGRDSAWVGAVDGLRINDTIYDFEPFGVEERPAS